MERIDKAMHRAGERYWLLSPSKKDYGTHGAMVMSLPVYKLEGGKYTQIGYAKIKPDGSFSLPRGLRQELNL